MTNAKLIERARAANDPDTAPDYDECALREMVGELADALEQAEATIGEQACKLLDTIERAEQAEKDLRVFHGADTEAVLANKRAEQAEKDNHRLRDLSDSEMFDRMKQAEKERDELRENVRFVDLCAARKAAIAKCNELRAEVERLNRLVAEKDESITHYAAEVEKLEERDD